MTYLWSGMILIGIVYGALTGNLKEVTDAAVSSSKEAVNLCIAMAGITAMWTGIMKIAETAGLVEQLSGRLRPLLRFLFPELPADSRACKYISLNFLSNVLGLAWAATPAGLMAFKELERINREECETYGGMAACTPDTASNAMCTFLIINVSSLQLIPVNVIAYRSQYGSVNPAAIVGPAILATAVSTGVAIVFCKIMNRKRRV